MAKLNLQSWDVSRSTLAKIESGIRAVSDAEVWALAKALKCTPADLLGGDPKEISEVLTGTRVTPRRKQK